MFKKLYKTFYYEVSFYVVDVPIEKVIERIDHLFMNKSDLFKSPNLSGKFVDFPETFYLTQKWWLVQIRNFENEPAILKGVLSKANDTQTKIEIAVRPNSIYLIFLGFFTPYGLYHIYNAVLTKDANSLYIGLWIFLFCLPLFYVVAKISSSRLRATFEKYMDLTPTNEEKLRITSTSIDSLR